MTAGQINEFFIGWVKAAMGEGTVCYAGLTVKCVVDRNEYKKGIEVSDEELAKVNLHKDEFHGDWNYSILPHLQTLVNKL